MAEKDAGRYRYEPYQPLTSKQQDNGGKSCDPPTTLKISGNTGKVNVSDDKSKTKSKSCCCCMGPKARSFWIMNLGICSLLFGYTLLGSFLFLAIEGGASSMHQRTLASTNRNRITSTRNTDNITLSETTASEALDARQKTVENIWEITVSLNILYRENWTRLAALEIGRFQDQLIRKLTDEMNAQQHQEGTEPATDAVIVPYYQMQEHEWTLSRAFLYSLTVLTTIEAKLLAIHPTHAQTTPQHQIYAQQQQPQQCQQQQQLSSTNKPD